MPDTGAPWNIPYVAPTDNPRVYPAADEAQALAIAAGLTDASLIKQVVQNLKTDTFSTTSTSFVNVTGASVTITPSTNTSKVLVICYGVLGQDHTGGSPRSIHVRLTGGNSSDFVGAAAGSRAQAIATATSQDLFRGDRTGFSFTATYLDSPATTSAVTYQLQALVNASTGYVGRSGDDTNSLSSGRYPTGLIAIEVAA